MLGQIDDIEAIELNGQLIHVGPVESFDIDVHKEEVRRGAHNVVQTDCVGVIRIDADMIADDIDSLAEELEYE